MKILGKLWITNKDGTVGMVVTESMMGKRKIRCGKTLTDTNAKIDAEFIAAWGATVPISELQRLINIVEKKT